MQTLKSPVTWTIIGTFVFGGLSAITGLIPESYAAIITIVLNILGVLIHHKQVVGGKLGRMTFKK